MLRTLQARALLLPLQFWILWALWLRQHKTAAGANCGLRQPGLLALRPLDVIHLSGQPPLVDPRSCSPLS